MANNATSSFFDRLRNWNYKNKKRLGSIKRIFKQRKYDKLDRDHLDDFGYEDNLRRKEEGLEEDCAYGNQDRHIIIELDPRYRGAHRTPQPIIDHGYQYNEVNYDRISIHSLDIPVSHQSTDIPRKTNLRRAKKGAKRAAKSSWKFLKQTMTTPKYYPETLGFLGYIATLGQAMSPSSASHMAS